MHFSFFFLRGESIPFIRFSMQRGRLIWPSKRDGCQTSALHKAITFALIIDPFHSADTSMSFEWPHYFFLLNWVRVGPPIQPKCRWGHCDWTAIYTIGNKFWEMKSVIRPPFHTTTTKTEMGYNIGTWSKEVSKIKRQDCIHYVIKHLGASSMDKTGKGHYWFSTKYIKLLNGHKTM